MSNSELSGYVNESGYTYDTGWPGTNITYSYGKHAPETRGSNYAWGIYSSGIVAHDDFHGRSSYGVISPQIQWDGSSLVILPHGPADYLSNYAAYNSYGRDTPATNYVSSAGIVNPKGILGIFSNVYNFSYGRDTPATNGANYAWPVYPTGSVSLGTFTVVNDVSYGWKIAEQNHTNETINAFRISSSGDIDGRNWIFTTGSYGFIRINLSIITEK